MTNAQANFVTNIGTIAEELWPQYRVLPSLTVAQAILESNWGNSGLTLASNNLFGMKGSYNGGSILYPTKEYVNGKYVSVNATFKKYPTLKDSVVDHAGLFNRLTRYHNILGDTDYKSVCAKVQSDGYATAPTYAQSLIKIIEQYNLSRFDISCSSTATKFYVFSSGKITIGDMKRFRELAEELVLKEYKITEQ